MGPRALLEDNSEAVVLEALKARVRQLESSERRLKTKLRHDKELLEDARGTLEEVQNELLDAEEELDKSEGILKATRQEVDRYRGWWLNEYYSIKVLLQLVPNPREVAAIAATSHSRFMTYSGHGSS